MLNIAEITNLTGNIYITGSRNCITNLCTTRTLDLGSYQLIDDATGKNILLPTQKQLPDYRQDTLPYRLLATTTGADVYGCQTLLTMTGFDFFSDNTITNASFSIYKAVAIRNEKKVAQPVSLHLLQESSPSRKKHEITDLASRLRDISNLDIESLAQIFKVSRVTYHRWLRGLPVSKKHRDYILETLPLLEEAAQRLGSPEAVSIWLLTPISSGGKKPIEYLAEKHYDLFRGFLLNQKTEKQQFHPLKPSRRVFKPRKREEIEDVREQLRPHTWYDEPDELNNTNK